MSLFVIRDGQVYRKIASGIPLVPQSGRVYKSQALELLEQLPSKVLDIIHDAHRPRGTVYGHRDDPFFLKLRDAGWLRWFPGPGGKDERLGIWNLTDRAELVTEHKWGPPY